MVFTREIPGSDACKPLFSMLKDVETLEPLPAFYLSMQGKKGAGARFIRKNEKSIIKGTFKEKKESSE